MSGQEQVTFVLAHGAWADGSSWDKVIHRLQSRGLSVVAAPLPLTSFADDVTAVNRVIDRVGGPVVLAGHAYAGAVIGNARGEAVRSVVFIAALAPDEGETVADVFYRADPDPHAPVLAPDRHGLIWLPGEAFASAFAQNATSEEQALLNAVQRPIAAGCIGAPAAQPLWRDRPSWFLVAEQDRMIVADTQRFMAQRMGATVRTHRVDHAPMVSAPDDVVAILLEAAVGPE